MEGGIERTPLGIPEIDEIIGGGVVKGSIILIAGHPGTGKTTFGARFLYYGATVCSEPGVYVSFAETRDDFYKYMGLLDLDFKSLEERGLFKYLSLPTISDRDVINLLVETIASAIKEVKAKRIVIDSISALSPVLTPGQLRSFLHTGLIPLLKRHGITGIVIADIPFGQQFVGYGVEEFIVDGVILMKLERGVYRFERVMEIRKLRGVQLPVIELTYTIVPVYGIKPLLVVELELARRKREVVGVEEKPLKTGNKYLDAMLSHITPGAQILLTGPSGAGKSVLALYLSVQAVKQGYKAVYVTLDETVDAIRRRACYLRLGGDVEGLRIVSINPVSYTLSEINKVLEELVDKEKPDLITIDGIRALERISSEKLFWTSLIKLIMLMKHRGVHAVYVYASDFPKEKIPIDTIADMIFVLQLSIGIRGVSRGLIVWKNRYGPAPERTLQIIIHPEKGVSIE